MLLSFYYDFDSKKHKFKFETVTLFQNYNRPDIVYIKIGLPQFLNQWFCSVEFPFHSEDTVTDLFLYLGPTDKAFVFVNIDKFEIIAFNSWLYHHHAFTDP